MTGTSGISEDTHLSYSTARRFSLFLVRWFFKVPVYFHVRDGTLSLTGINESFECTFNALIVSYWHQGHAQLPAVRSEGRPFGSRSFVLLYAETYERIGEQLTLLVPGRIFWETLCLREVRCWS